MGCAARHPCCAGRRSTTGQHKGGQGRAVTTPMCLLLLTCRGRGMSWRGGGLPQGWAPLSRRPGCPSIRPHPPAERIGNRGVWCLFGAGPSDVRAVGSPPALTGMSHLFRGPPPHPGLSHKGTCLEALHAGLHQPPGGSLQGQAGEVVVLRHTYWTGGRESRESRESQRSSRLAGREELEAYAAAADLLIKRKPPRLPSGQRQDGRPANHSPSLTRSRLAWCGLTRANVSSWTSGSR